MIFRPASAHQQLDVLREYRSRLRECAKEARGLGEERAEAGRLELVDGGKGYEFVGVCSLRVCRSVR